MPCLCYRRRKDWKEFLATMFNLVAEDDPLLKEASTMIYYKVQVRAENVIVERKKNDSSKIIRSLLNTST